MELSKNHPISVRLENRTKLVEFKVATPFSKVIFRGKGLFDSFTIQDDKGNVLVNSTLEVSDLIDTFRLPKWKYHTVEQLKNNGDVLITFDTKLTQVEIDTYRRVKYEQDWDCDWDADSAWFFKKSDDKTLLEDESEIKFVEWSKSTPYLTFIFKINPIFKDNPHLIIG